MGHENLEATFENVTNQCGIREVPQKIMDLFEKNPTLKECLNTNIGGRGTTACSKWSPQDGGETEAAVEEPQQRRDSHLADCSQVIIGGSVKLTNISHFYTAFPPPQIYQLLEQLYFEGTV